MSPEQGKFRPIIIARKLNLINLLDAVIDSPVLRMRIGVGRQLEGEAVKTKNGQVLVDHSDAKPGDLVVTHEI